MIKNVIKKTCELTGRRRITRIHKYIYRKTLIKDPDKTSDNTVLIGEFRGLVMN